MNKYSFCKLLLYLSLIGSILAACTTLPVADPQRSKQLQTEAKNLTFLKNYPVAVEKYAEAILYDPQNSVLYQQQAEVQEVMQQFTQAAKTYQLALKRLPQNHSALEMIHYRYGLLLALEGKAKKAGQNLAHITDKSMHTDLQGFIALKNGDQVAALNLFSQALKASEHPDQQARIHYHAALAHHDRGAIPDSRNALFYAVNNASSLALKQHIRIFFEQLQNTR